MFGCCVAGRLLQTNLVEVDQTHAYFELPRASTINHVCVFLLGTIPFPEGYGAAVHFYWPGKGFQLLGMLSNEKPSAIFRLRGTFNATASTASNAQNRFSAISSQSGMGEMGAESEITAILGLSIEPLSQIQIQVSGNPTSNNAVATRGISDPTILAERIVKHLLNYITGFTGDSGVGIGHKGGVDVAVPMSVIARWYESFIGKIKAGGTAFLERVE